MSSRLHSEYCGYPLPTYLWSDFYKQSENINTKQTPPSLRLPSSFCFTFYVPTLIQGFPPSLPKSFQFFSLEVKNSEMAARFKPALLLYPRILPILITSYTLREIVLYQKLSLLVWVILGHHSRRKLYNIFKEKYIGLSSRATAEHQECFCSQA